MTNILIPGATRDRAGAAAAGPSPARFPHGCRRVQSGVGLIEILVAVLVLSIGFLGVAALQVMSLSTNNSAMARSMATIASYSILDAMRADITTAGAGGYNTTVGANACPAVVAGSLASVQLNRWCTQLAQNLGAAASPQGTIACTGASPVNCTVTIAFDDSRAGVGGSSNQKIITQSML
ncbi:MAG: type IV pilus modification protein PilV [Xanthomonadaceae bacterium]|nr:type IV pilus modification protein PilV [Xanthomonadaceae bacterium]